VSAAVTVARGQDRPRNKAQTARPLRVVQVVRSLRTGGQEMLLTRLVERLDPSRFAITVVVLQGHDEAGGALWRRVEARGIEVRALLAPPAGFSPRLVVDLARVLRELRVDVVHAHNFQPLLYAGLASRLAPGVAIVATAHGYRTWSTFRFDRILRRLLPRHVVAAVSPELASALRARGYRPEVVLNGVDVDRLARPVDRAPCRAALGLDRDAWVVGTVGRLSAEKDQATLLRAMRRVLDVEPNARLLVAGDGELRGELEALAADLGLGDRARFLGEQSDVHAFLSALDVFCLPSRTEGTSLSLLEAMAVEVPVVATAVGGTPSVVDGGAAARLVPPNDAEALAAALLDVRRDRAAAGARAALGRRIVVSRFALRKMVDRYAALYTRVATR
jgi:glycosyltransferase involved in cell wall biosynthesis